MSAYDDFKKIKQAGFGDTARRVGQAMPEALAMGLGAVGATAAVGGLGVASQKIYDAMTKRRDFNAMLEHNPDLVEHHQNNPKSFNQMFTTLRTMNPQFSKDPLVAGTYMRRMAESPLSAGGVAVEAFGHHRPSPSITNAMIDAGGGTTREALKDNMAAQRAESKAPGAAPPYSPFKQGPFAHKGTKTWDREPAFDNGYEFGK